MILLNFDSQTFQKNVLNWTDSMKIGTAQFKMSENSEASIYATCFALYIYDLMGQVKNWSLEEKKEWKTFISSFQDEKTGYFIPENHTGDLTSKPVHQLTTFCMSALRVLSEKPEYELKFIKQWLNKKDAYSYLENKGCFRGLPGSGNAAMFLAIFLTYYYENTKDKAALNVMEQWFALHNETQNTDTGFWGDLQYQKYYEGFQNALHQFVIYRYWNRVIPNSEKIVNMVLKLQARDGFFSPYPGGSGCYDFDAADTLIYCGLKENYREKDVKKALENLYSGILKNVRNEDGGFCETKVNLNSMKDVFSVDSLKFIFNTPFPYLWYYNFRNLCKIAKQRNSKKSHWSKSITPWNQSDLWNTWFRCLTLAEISDVIETPLSGTKWNYLKTIGLGWFNSD